MEHNRVIALGFFDGVHRGHGALLARCRQRADERGCRAAVMTFDLHPDTLVTGQDMGLLSSPEDRADLMRRLYGIDDVLVCHFDRTMMEMPWQAFVEDYLFGKLDAAAVVCGHDFRFGYRGEGNPQRLAEVCAQLGMGCDVIGKVEYDGVTVSSTYIRSLIETGDMARANAFLGHRHTLSGEVVHGRQLGRRMGTPTANLLLPAHVLAPAFGVYAAEVFTAGGVYMAVTNVGVRPTVGGGDVVTVEPWLLDFDGDLYGQTIRVEFCQFLRPERKFDSLEQLQSAILENADQTRAYFESH